jgi:hypothetical protein
MDEDGVDGAGGRVCEDVDRAEGYNAEEEEISHGANVAK